MRHMKLTLGLLLTVLTACSVVGSSVQIETIHTDATRNEAPSQLDIPRLVAGNTQFAFDLYHQLAQEQDGNLIFSPHSISTAFAMLYAGARGDTEAQMAAVLHYDLSQSQLHSAFNALDLALQPPANPTPVPTDAFIDPAEELVLKIANGVWGQEGLPFEPDYLETLARNYGAGVGLLDFGADPADAREVIRRWIDAATEGRITDMPPQDTITPATQLVLANAIYFKGEWVYPFASNTQNAPFYLADGSDVSVPMMVAQGYKGCARFDGYNALQLEYGASEAAAMVILLPDSGTFEAFEERLDAELFQTTLAAIRPTNSMRFAMPRFKFESTVNLGETLAAMGLHLPFSAAADFSGLSSVDLSVDSAIHKALISVDEQGTEAAGVTIISMLVSSIGSECGNEVLADRPFIFAIYNTETNAILFLGRVLNPVA